MSETTIKKTKEIDEKFCNECGEAIKSKAEICPKCGVRQLSTHLDTFSSTHQSPKTDNSFINDSKGDIIILIVIIIMILPIIHTHLLFPFFGRGISSQFLNITSALIPIALAFNVSKKSWQIFLFGVGGIYFVYNIFNIINYRYY